MARFQPPGSPKRPTPQQADDEDAFLTRIVIFSAWARKNSQILIVVGALVAAVVVGSIYYLNTRGASQEQATLQLEQIQQAVEMGERAGATDQLETFLAQHGGTDVGQEARLLLGQLHLEANETEQAIAALEPAMRSLRHPVALQSALLLGVAYELADRPEDAEEAYLSVGEESSMDFQRRDALASAARIRAARGDLEGAAALYNDILATFEADDPDRGLYQMRLSEVEVRQALN